MTPTRRTQDRKQGRAHARAFAVLVALVALLIQAFVVQIHTHDAVPYVGAAIERPADHNQPGHAHFSEAHDQAGCITCIAFAASGRAILADAVLLSAAHDAVYETAALAIRRAPRALTHSWRSRAPPLAL